MQVTSRTAGSTRNPLAVYVAAVFAVVVFRSVLGSDTDRAVGFDLVYSRRVGPLRTQRSESLAGGRKRAAEEKALTFQTPKRPATTLEVTNCDDSSPGSLRQTVAAAADSDSIDMTHLTCSAITLDTGAIIVAVDNLTLNGPGAAALYLDGGYLSNISHYSADIYHLGRGTLEINGLHVGDGFYVGGYRPSGGCIYSKGSIRLSNSEVTYCSLNPPPSGAQSLGGAIYAFSGVYLDHTKVIGGSAYSPSSPSRGGGIFSERGFTSIYSTVSNNHSRATDGRAYAGGIYAANGPVLILNSAITDNYSGHNIGGIDIFFGSGAVIANSTISGNAAGNTGGGVGLFGAALSLSNSTIAFNSEANAGKNPRSVVAAGIYMYKATLMAQSSIIAENFNDAFPSNPYSDVSGYDSSVSGADNLARFAYLAMPADTIYADPLLHVLAYNGGLTPTLALSASSPALNSGNDSGSFNYDQRGHGYPRVIGANADIGAFELDDLIFASGFE